MGLDLGALAKVQLHCHLEGTVRAETFRALAVKYGVPLGERADPARTYAFETFREFLLLFAKVTEALREPDDFGRIARDYVADAAAQGVLYAEIFISPSVWSFFHPELNVRAAVEAIRSALDEDGARLGVEVALIADLTRNFGVERAEATARAALGLRDLGVVAVGLGGDEANYPPELYERAFAIAREGGLHGVAHAGGAAGPARDLPDLEPPDRRRTGRRRPPARRARRCGLHRHDRRRRSGAVWDDAARGVPLRRRDRRRGRRRALRPERDRRVVRRPGDEGTPPRRARAIPELRPGWSNLIGRCPATPISTSRPRSISKRSTVWSARAPALSL